MESKGKDSNTMDRHNNQIGSQIGATSKTFRDLEPAVRQAVSNGAINSTNTNQITSARAPNLVNDTQPDQAISVPSVASVKKSDGQTLVDNQSRQHIVIKNCEEVRHGSTWQSSPQK